MRKIIDFHSHIFPDKIAEKATANIGRFYGAKMNCPNGSVNALLESGGKANINKYIVQSVATTANQVESINRFVAGECEKNDMLIGLGTIHPNDQNINKSIDLIKQLGLKGIKLHPDFQAFNIDDETAFEIYEQAQDKNLPILIHCGDFRYDYSHPRRLANVLKKFSKLTVVAAHFGGWSVWEDAVKYLKNESCYLDTSSTFGFTGAEKFKDLIDIFGSDRLLFGVDFPMWNHMEEVDNILSIGLTKQQEDSILYKNALKVLDIQC